MTLKYGRHQTPVTKSNVIKAKVEDPISTHLPTYVNGVEGRSDLLLVPLDSKYKIESNRAFGYKYSLAHSSSPKNSKTCGTELASDADLNKFSDVIDITQDGTLYTNNQRGRATLLVEDLYKNSEFQMVNLLVTPVYSVFVYNSNKASILPLQSVTKLRVMYQDEAGRLFPERLGGGNRISVQSSDPSVLEAELGENNDWVVVRAKKLGTSIVTVSLSENPAVYDAFPITVGSIVHPSSPVSVHVGGFIHFTATNEFSDESKEKWFSDDDKILKIDATSGQASAVKSGKANILLRDIVNFKSNVNVFRINKASMGSEAPKTLTNIENHELYQEEFQIPIRFHASSEEISDFNNENSNINNNLYLNCEVSEEVSELLSITSDIITDPKTNKQSPVCKIRINPSYPSDIKFAENIILTTKLQTHNKVFTHETDFHLKIVWAFKNMSEVTDIKLSRSANRKEIKYQSNGELEIKETHYLRKFLSHTYDRVTNIHVIAIEIPEDNENTFDGEIIVMNQKTGQKETLNVAYVPSASLFENVKVNFTEGPDMGMTDLVVIIVCGVLISFAVKIAFDNTKNKDEFSEKLLATGSNYNTVYGSNN